MAAEEGTGEEARVFTDQYIHGAWVRSTGSADVEVTDSSTERVIAKVPEGTKEDIDKAVAAAVAAFPGWSQTPVIARRELLVKFLAEFERKRPEATDAMTRELGCTPSFAHSPQTAVVGLHGEALLKAVEEMKWEEPKGKTTVVKEPVGVVGCITPWNYPLSQITLKVLPALLSGCTVVLKPSEVTPITAYIFAEAVHASGFPAGVFNMVVGLGAIVGEHLSAHPGVNQLSFTGSTRVARQLHVAAAPSLKRVRTELGGKSAALMLDDANLAEVVPKMLQQLTANTGQSCNALSRMLVPRSRYEEALTLAKDFMEQVKVGPPRAEGTTIGPLVSKRQWESVQGYLRKGIEEGARVVIGGPGLPEGLDRGYFVKPTVFADVHNKMTIAQEEIFGPVLCLIPYDDEVAAVAMTNDTIYGLNNAVCSADVGRALEVAGMLRSGMVMVNNTSMDMAAPFGGYKQSGDGREWGAAGFEECLLTKTINVPIEEYEAARKRPRV
eukprot:NODE_5346_length_1780_cov_30.647913.p1 GENE.NODE_5346_length_1780_cov_30.647913~~NODE_5346_length_1780_cov_30.647913.p1  ORF type:complete len:497 (-),score=145.92 NODE_5346_length_1780_cov_30.647913:218-1708(-)